MSRPHDARAVRSREALKRAILQLIETNQFDQIAIRDITAAAGVSYPVFFRRYGSKDELLKDVAEEEVRKLLSMSGRVEEDSSSPEAMLRMCRYVDEHRTLWRTLLTTGAATAMREEFMRIAQDAPPSWERRKPSLPHDLAMILQSCMLRTVFSTYCHGGYANQRAIQSRTWQSCSTRSSFSQRDRKIFTCPSARPARRGPWTTRVDAAYPAHTAE
jgi:AcrR family transcriptional regulator